MLTLWASAILSDSGTSLLGLPIDSLVAIIALLEPVVVVSVVYTIRRANRLGVRPIVIRYSPPSDVTPAESGMLLNGCLTSRDVTATLVDLIARGYVAILDTTPAASTPLGQHDLVFCRLKSDCGCEGLARHEKVILYQIFGCEDWSKLSRLKARFPDVVPAVATEVEGSLREKGMYRYDPNTEAGAERRTFWCACAILGFLIPSTLCVLVASLFLDIKTGGLASLMSAVSAGIAVWAIRNTALWTRKARERLGYLQGLRLFIEAVDADRIHRLDRNQLDSLLSYAIVFGLEDKWTPALRELAVPHLAWMGDDETDSVFRGSKLTVLSDYLQTQETQK